VKRDVASDMLLKKDLAVLFPSDEETDQAYALFDVDADGFVTEPEVHSAFKLMYEYVAFPLLRCCDQKDVMQLHQ
jgi:hypothetical protein